MPGLSSRALDKIQKIAVDLASESGLEVKRVEYAQSDIGWTLSVVVDRPEGVGVEDCERLARPLSRKLDELDVIKEHYYLEVSSPGVS